MKQLMFGLFVLYGGALLAQHHVYMGIDAGGGYTGQLSKYTGATFGSNWNGSSYNGQTHTINGRIDGVGGGAKLHLLYGYKIFRVGYQLDYLYIQNLRSTAWINPPEAPGLPNKSTGKSNQSLSSIGNSLLFEATAYRRSFFSISPGVSAGYFLLKLNTPFGGPTTYFQTGTSLQFGFDVKYTTFYIAPDYCIRFAREKIHYDSQLRNPFWLYQSLLLTLGVRGDVMAAIKAK